VFPESKGQGRGKAMSVKDSSEHKKYSGHFKNPFDLTPLCGSLGEFQPKPAVLSVA